MATSSSYNFSITGNQIIRAALLEVHGVGTDEDISGDQITDALLTLNAMVKHWHTQGWHEWNKRDVVIPLVNGQRSYSLGPSSSTDDHWALESDFVNTTLDGAVAASATTFDVTSATGIAASDNISIELDAGTRQWTTVSSISDTTVTPADTVTSAAADDNTVFAYTSRPQRPLKILAAVRNSVSSTSQGSDVEVFELSHEEYRYQPSKTSTGTAVGYRYVPSLTSGTLYVWQPPGDSNQLLKATIEYPIEDFDAASNNPDFPQEAYLTLYLNLAKLLERQYGQLDAVRRKELREDADRTLIEWLGFDSDPGSMKFQPAR